jgi:hypothetical protein
MPATRFHNTRHLIVRLEERGLSLEALRNVVNCPDSQKHQGTGQHGGKLFLFSKTVDGQKLCCVAELKRKECWIVTGYYED